MTQSGASSFYEALGVDSHFLFAPQNCSFTSSLKLCANLCSCVPPGATNRSTLRCLDGTWIPTVDIRASHLRWIFAMSCFMDFFMHISDGSMEGRTGEKLPLD
jgi:hypothetical protein